MRNRFPKLISSWIQLELMRRKQSMQHFDQRQQLLLENAYYQVIQYTSDNHSHILIPKTV